MRFERHFIFWVAAFLVFVGLLWLLREILLPFVAGAALAVIKKLVKPAASQTT